MKLKAWDLIVWQPGKLCPFFLFSFFQAKHLAVPSFLIHAVSQVGGWASRICAQGGNERHKKLTEEKLKGDGRTLEGNIQVLVFRC